MSPNAPFLAPERDSAFKRGRAKQGSTSYYLIPGCTPQASVNTTLTANQDLYSPVFVDTSVLVDQFAAEVSTLIAAQNFRMGLYAADGDWQPVGAPLADSGDISSATTGVKTYTPATPLLVPRGRYLTVVNASAGPALKGPRDAISGAPHDTILGGVNGYGNYMTVTRTYAAFPTPGTAWTAVVFPGSGGGIFHPVFFRISGP